MHCAQIATSWLLETCFIGVTYGSFQVKSSKILIQPDIIDSDFLENLHSCYIPWKKNSPKVFFFSVKWPSKYGSSKFDQFRMTHFLWRLISQLLWHLGRWFLYHWRDNLKYFLGMLFNRPQLWTVQSYSRNGH